MTTYATSTTQQPALSGGPPAPPPQDAGGPPIQRGPRSRRPGIVVAAGAFAFGAAATLATACALATPVTPAQHTVNIVPPPPSVHGSSEIQAAKGAACSAWDRAARMTAQASKSSAAALNGNRDYEAPVSAAALINEKRTRLAAISYLRTQMSPATPPDVAQPIELWTAASVDELHALVQRSWGEAEVALQRGNSLINPITDACGLR